MSDDTVPLLFDVAGPRDAPAVVLLHGFPFTRAEWTQVMMPLSERYRVYAPDLRGHGASPTGAGTATMEKMADDVLAFAEEQGVRDFALVGHSMGGYVAFQVARKAPDRVKALVLVTTRASPDADAVKANRRKQADMVQLDGLKALADLLIPKLVAPAAGSNVREEARRMVESNKVSGIVAALDGMAERPDATPILEGVKAPTLVVAGGEDQVMPRAEQDVLVQKIPNARLEVMGGSGHLPMMEEAPKFAGILGAFLDEHLKV